VFYDEEEFYYQLMKVLEVTKVPVILTLNNKSDMKKEIISLLKERHIDFEEVFYSTCKIKGKEVKAILQIIGLFEYYVHPMIE